MRDHHPLRRTKKLLTLSALEGGHLAELRHDFRAHYGVGYDDVADVEEAIDLIRTLPRGCMYRRARLGYMEWDDAREGIVALLDRMTMLACATRGIEDYPQVPRPEEKVMTRRAKERARAARRKMQETKWEEVEPSG